MMANNKGKLAMDNNEVHKKRAGKYRTLRGWRTHRMEKITLERADFIFAH
jgi:hypothetical protein